ncbi:MAG: sugar phosphate isomerase/epimerase [Chthonomonadales bacterium]|nr:sugar phosphate isomerase/epimerase [Chthonomonadales bacterium]
MTARKLPPPPARAGDPVLRVGCCAYSYRSCLTGSPPTMSLEGFLDRCAELGCDGVELTAYYFPTPITPRYLRRIVRRCLLLGLDVCGTAIGNSFALPPGPERNANIVLARHWIDLSCDLGSPCLRVFAGAVPKGVSQTTGRKWVAECLAECLPYAEDRGVMLALENHGGVVAEPAGVLDILSRVQSEWLGVKLDTGNFVSDDPYRDLAVCAPYAISTHIKTEVRQNGVLQQADMGKIAGLLRDAGYRGFMNLEYEAAEDAVTAVPKAIAAMLSVARAAS